MTEEQRQTAIRVIDTLKTSLDRQSERLKKTFGARAPSHIRAETDQLDAESEALGLTLAMLESNA